MKVLFICHANICRSFMAQEFLKQFLPQVQVFSRGFYADPAYQVPPKVKAALAAHQIAFAGHTATPLTAADLEQADLIFCMESAHEERLLDRYPQYTDKIWLLPEFATGDARDVSDPVGLQGRSFAHAAEELYELCQAAAVRMKTDFLAQK